MLSSSDQSHGPWRGAKPCYSPVEKLNVVLCAAGPHFSVRHCETWNDVDLTCAPVRLVTWPVWVVVQVQRTRGQQLRQLLVVVEVQGEVRGDDGLPDDLQHLLVLAGIQVGENIVPFQLWETKRSIKKQKLHLWGVQLSWTKTGCNLRFISGSRLASRSWMLHKRALRTKSYDPFNGSVTDNVEVCKQIACSVFLLLQDACVQIKVKIYKMWRLSASLTQ